MDPNLLILGGTTEATAFAQLANTSSLRGTVSFAGRVARPKRQPLPQRIGGFGGIAGLQRYLSMERITHVIDATHPFAAQMSRNAVAACAETGVPLVALTRPPWHAVEGDQWQSAADIASAVAALDQPRKRIMLAVGRMHLADFAPNPQHYYLLRLIDPPHAPLPLPDSHIIVDRGPFAEAADRALMDSHGIELVVSKNAGGTAAYAKIAAARDLGLPVLMIDRPLVPPRSEVTTPEAALAWIQAHSTNLGV
ncbi:MAG: cobalt-precorrin-6A reductase [Pseudomonadota bacterium]